MNHEIYHAEIGFPKIVNVLYGQRFILSFSTHAKLACRNDRYGFIIPPTAVTVTEKNLIEVETENGVITKVLVRVPYERDSKKDISIAFIPQGKFGFVKTLWLNLTSDIHTTLDKSKYNTP